VNGSAALAATVASSELPDDLTALARRHANRKVRRFLDRASMPPFVAALEAFHRARSGGNGSNGSDGGNGGDGDEGYDPAEVGLFTVSSWDPTVPDPPFVDDGTAARRVALSRYVLETANPTSWLRMLTNNALCQASIAAGFQGPNAHAVGGATALRQALLVAAGVVNDRAAALAIVVAYDPPAGTENLPPDRAVTSAAAVALAPGGDDAVDLLAEAARKDGQAVEALDRGIAQWRTVGR
jgi:hypothetical protein